jgi:hypothetical protein
MGKGGGDATNPSRNLAFGNQRQSLVGPFTIEPSNYGPHHPFVMEVISASILGNFCLFQSRDFTYKDIMINT